MYNGNGISVQNLFQFQLFQLKNEGVTSFYMLYN